MTLEMTFKDFKNIVQFSTEEICREIYQENRETIKIKKEPVAVKNLGVIFKAALELSNEKGFHAMSIRDLSSRSGLSMGALYSYFKSKEELLDIIQTQGISIGFKVLTRLIDQSLPPEEKLRVALRTHLYLSELLYSWFYFSYMEAKNLPKEKMKKFIEAELYTEKIFIDILEEGQKKNIFRAVDAVLTASIIKAILQDWYLKRWKYKRRNITIEDYTDFVIKLVEGSVNPEK